MSKPKTLRGVEDHEAQSVVSNLRISPRKLNLVAGLIRNQPVGKAVATLAFSKRRIAQDVKKALESAVANAENNHSLDVDKLMVARVEVGRAAVMRRFHARGRGRSARIEKWLSNLKIVVAEAMDEVPAADFSPSEIEGTATTEPEIIAPEIIEPEMMEPEMVPETETVFAEEEV